MNEQVVDTERLAEADRKLSELIRPSRGHVQATA
jgi:hypothetical protein